MLHYLTSSTIKFKHALSAFQLPMQICFLNIMLSQYNLMHLEMSLLALWFDWRVCKVLTVLFHIFITRHIVSLDALQTTPCGSEDVYDADWLRTSKVNIDKVVKCRLGKAVLSVEHGLEIRTHIQMHRFFALIRSKEQKIVYVLNEYKWIHRSTPMGILC